MWHTITNLFTRDPTAEVLSLLSNYVKPYLDEARAGEFRLLKTVIVARYSS